MLHHRYLLVGLCCLLVLVGGSLTGRTGPHLRSTPQSCPQTLPTGNGGPTLLSTDYTEELPDFVWEQIVPLLPLPKPKKKTGRPRMKDRQVMAAIFYLLRTDCPWNDLPRDFGPYSTVYGRLKEWRSAGVFTTLRQKDLLPYSAREGFD